MISELYTGLILDAAADIPPACRLNAPDASAKKVSRVCGSEVAVDIKVDSGVITDFAMTARACALGQAAASLVAQNIIGASASELLALRNQMRVMLKEDGPVPNGERWRTLAALQPIREYPQRHASTMLVFDAVADCLQQLGYGE